MIAVKPIEVIIDSCVIFDSLKDINSFSDSQKRLDKTAIDKLIDMKSKGVISCTRTINLEFETAKDKRQDEIDAKWGDFSVRDIGIGLLANLKIKHYDKIWDKIFMGLKGNSSKGGIDASVLAQAEYFGIKYIISTDYTFIKRAAKKSQNIEVVKPIDFLKKIGSL